jgi:hypothetical protein
MRKIVVFAFIAAATLAALATAMFLVIPLARAQGDGEAVPVAPETTFGWVVLSWLIYAVAGLVASMTTSNERFDASKFARSLIIMLLTGFFALAFKISPVNIETEFGGIITIIANTIVNAAPGVTLIYIVDKVWKLIANLKTKIEATRALSAPGPPSPS